MDHRCEDTPSPVSKEGFAAVSSWVATDPDNETFVYRKFDDLAARNLLYLQSELLCLEKELHVLDREDAEGEDMEAKDAARTWETLVRQSDAGLESARKRMDLIRGIRAKLKEYRELPLHRPRGYLYVLYNTWLCDYTLSKQSGRLDEALLLQSELFRLHRPNKRVVEAYRHWLKEPFDVLGGEAKKFLNNENDLVAVKTTAEVDSLSRILRQYWPVKVNRLIVGPLPFSGP